MLPPHELKNKNFSRVLRGYNSVEVDEQINFIIEKYTELYRQNDELERKLKTAEAKLAEFRADEESIRSALVNAQKASAKIIGEANERADVIIRSAKTNCNKVIANFRNELQKEREDLQTLRRAVGEFKARLFAQYQQHISYIEEISPDVEADDADMPDEVFVRRVVNRVKNDIASGKVAPNATPDDDTDINATTAKNTAETQSGQQPPQPPAPAIKEITRVPSAENALQQSADNKAEDEEDGGGYLDDMLDDADLTDIDDTKSYTSASNAAANNAVANNAAASNASANNASASNAVANNAVAKAADNQTRRRRNRKPSTRPTPLCLT